MAKQKYYTTTNLVKSYESTAIVFSQLFKEVKELSKKKPEGAMNKLKVAQINRILADIKSFLMNEPEAKYLDLLEDATLPELGDAVLIMSQYEGALQSFRDRYFGFNGLDHAWFIKD